jgi:PUA domain protein
MPKKEELRKKDIQKVSSSLASKYPEDFCNFIASNKLFKSELFIKERIITLYHTSDNTPLLMEEHNKILPTLYSIRKYPDLLPKITVDAGAVKFMINGADLFRPGIVEYQKFEKDDFVTIINLQNAAMNIGKALLSSLELPDKGKVTQTIHYLNDEIWKYNQI